MRFFVLFVFLFVAGCTSLELPGELKRSDFRGPSAAPIEKYEEYVPSTTQIPSTRELRLDWPVMYPSRINRGFQTSDELHYGIDFSGKKNAPILSSHSGTVIYVGRKFRGYGNLVIIEMRDGIATFYAHLNKVLVKEGQYVRSGDTIGLMGRTGRASGVHLHFELRVQYAPVDPMPFFPSLRTSSN